MNEARGRIEDLPGGGYLVNTPIAKISVPDNRLRELRDYDSLAASIAEIGLQSPITVTASGRLVAGWHRLEAVKQLGWTTIPAFIVEDDELLNRLAEIDENLRRQDLVVWERTKHTAERERVLAALGRRAERGDNRHTRPATVAGLEKTTADLAKEAGVSERTIRRDLNIGRALAPDSLTAAVLDHADPTDEKQRNLLNSTTQLDHLANIARKHGDEKAARVAELALTEEGGNTFKVYDGMKREREKAEREARREELRASVKEAPPLERRYEVIYADPPWRYEHSKTENRSLDNQYPQMDLDDIKLLDVPAAEHATLFMWATSPKLSEAMEVMAAWGFEYRTCMVWVKDRIGMGYYARQKHELLLIGRKGEPPVPAPENRPPSVFEFPRGEHSAKPEGFYEVIETMYPAETKVELFARSIREGWDGWGNQLPGEAA